MGTNQVRLDILKNKTEEQIRSAWQKKLNQYKEIRKSIFFMRIIRQCKYKKSGRLFISLPDFLFQSNILFRYPKISLQLQLFPLHQR